jgi:cytochrome c-type biogenesis protein
MLADVYIYLGVAMAGLLSFLSPCVLPLVPAYIGQLSAIAVAGRAPGAAPSRWLAVRHSLAYVAGFGAVFTLLGVTATFAAGPLYDFLVPLRIIGGLILIVLGLSLAGILRIPALDRTWRPLEAGAAGSLAAATGTVALGSGAGEGSGPGIGERLGGRVVSPRGGWLASFGLGAIFAIGWTPCIGIILGAILTMAVSSGTVAQGTILLIAYTIGLGVPFILIALLYDRAPALTRPLVRHGRTVSLIGGLLVVAIGLAMVFDLLRYLPMWFGFVSLV